MTEPSHARSPGGPLFQRALVALKPEEENPRLWSVLDWLLKAGTEIVVCHVELRSTHLAGDEADCSPVDARELEVQEGLRRLLKRYLGPAGHGLPIRILHGDPGQRILEHARFAGCDLVVLGTRAPPSVGRALRGSVRRYVVGDARKNVLAVGE